MNRKSVRAWAKALEMSPTTVMKYLHRANPPDENGMILVRQTVGRDGRMRPDRRCDTTGRDALIRQRRAEGKSVRAIAAEVSCSVGTVHRVIKAG